PLRTWAAKPSHGGVYTGRESLKGRGRFHTQPEDPRTTRVGKETEAVHLQREVFEAAQRLQSFHDLLEPILLDLTQKLECKVNTFRSGPAYLVGMARVRLASGAKC